MDHWWGIIAAAVVAFFVRKSIETFLMKSYQWLKLQYRKLSESRIAKQTYFQYRAFTVPESRRQELTKYLESRYECEAFALAGHSIPATVLWKNTDQLINPDAVLGTLDVTVPKPFYQSPILPPNRYRKARSFVKQKLEAGPIKYEGCDYRMLHIDKSASPPKIQGALGLYYDSILTQYAMDWEFKRLLYGNSKLPIVGLVERHGLPLREAIGNDKGAFFNAADRCAAITVSTFLVFQRRNLGYHCLVKRRSSDVAVDPGILHVSPAAMFEAKSADESWSITTNIWRELLEEVYGEKELIGTGQAEIQDFLSKKEPVSTLLKMIKSGSAQLSLTAIAFDLLNLRPEICTVLFVEEPEYFECRQPTLNWEYGKEFEAGTGIIPLRDLDKMLHKSIPQVGISATGAVSIGLGREWIQTIHNI